MATQTFAPPGILTPFITPPGVVRENTTLPFGQLSFTMEEALASAVANDQIFIDLKLPPNYVFRLSHFEVWTNTNSAPNDWDLSTYYRHYWSPTEATQEAAQELRYPLYAAPLEGGSTQSFYYITPGGNAARNAIQAISSPSDLLLTQIPAGVGSLDPGIFIFTDGAVSAGTIRCCVIFDVFNIEQRNHAILHDSTPTI